MVEKNFVSTIEQFANILHTLAHEVSVTRECSTRTTSTLLPNDLLTACSSGEAFVELEARFGMKRNGRFVPGLGARETYRGFLWKLREADCWSRGGEIPDLMYDFTTETLNEVPTRTRWRLTGANLQPVLTHEQKHHICNFDFPVVEDVVCRLSLCIEMTKHPQLEPDQLTFTQALAVRCKERSRFEFESEPGLSWAYEISRVWQGSTRSKCARDRHTEENTSYEFEIECQNVLRFVERRTAKGVLESLLMKVRDFVPLLAPTQNQPLQ